MKLFSKLYVSLLPVHPGLIITHISISDCDVGVCLSPVYRDMTMHCSEADEEEAHSIVEEALELRRQRQAKLAQPPLQDLQLVEPIKRFT